MKKIALLLPLLLLSTGLAFGQTTFYPVGVDFPQIAAGGDPAGVNYVTIIQAVNNNSFGTSAHLALFSDTGTPLSVLIDGQGPQSTLDFTLASGATRQIQLTANGAVTAGWMQITYFPSDAATTVILQFRSGTTLLSEVGIQPVSSAILGADFAAETDTSTGLNTGIALVNPTSTASGVVVTLWDPATGNALASTPISLSANGHIAKYLTELFPTAANITKIRTQVSLSACSDTKCTAAPASGNLMATALRLNGAQSTTIPIIERPGGTALVRVLPQVALGGPSAGINYQTILYLTTIQSAGVFGTIDIFDDNGNPLPASANGAAAASSIPFSVLGARVTKIVLSGDQTLRSGWIRLTLPSSVNLIANAVFQTYSGSTLVSEAGVLDSQPTVGGVIYVSAESGASNVGVAFANPQATPITIALTLFDQSGFVAATQNVTLPAYGHLAHFVTEIFPQALPSFTGALDIYCPTAFSAVALRLTGPNLATLPLSDQGMYRPAITALRVTSTVKSPAQVNFSMDVTDFDADLASATSVAVLADAEVAATAANGGQVSGQISIDGTAMINQTTGTISGSFQLPGVASLPSGFTGIFYIEIYDSKSNVSNIVSVPVKF
jgi:hypothetical protein